MGIPSRNLVHHLVARHAGVGEFLIADEQTLDDLGLDPLDVIFIVAQLGTAGELRVDVPLEPFAEARTVGTLVQLVDEWREDDGAVLHYRASCSVTDVNGVTHGGPAAKR